MDIKHLFILSLSICRSQHSFVAMMPAISLGHRLMEPKEYKFNKLENKENLGNNKFFKLIVGSA